MSDRSMIKIKEQDLVLKVGNNVNTKLWDESKYYKFLDEFTGIRKYQKEAILTALRFTCGGEYENTKQLAKENFEQNEAIQEKYVTYTNFEKSLKFVDNYTASLDLATGTGKSWVLYGIAVLMLASKKVDQVLILVPSVTIETELTDKFRQFAIDEKLNNLLNETPPKILNGSESIVSGSICIENRDAIYNNSSSSIIDSLLKKGDRTLVLSDEVHHLYYTEENEWKNFIKKINFKYIIGVSGTCYYNDNNYFSDVIYRYSLKKAIEESKVKMVEYVSESNVPNKMEDRWEVIIKSHDEIKSKINYRPLTLIVNANINSCKKTAAEFKKILKNKYKYTDSEVDDKVLVIHSQTSAAADRIKLKTVDAQGSNVEWIFSVSMLTEGWDVKRVFQIVPHEERAFNSKLLIAQVLGRGLRLPNDWDYNNSGHPKVIIFNHSKWANSVKKLVDEILEIEKKISSTVILNSTYNFELLNVKYKPEKTVTKTKKQDTYKLFERGYVYLPTDNQFEKIETSFTDVISNETRNWSTTISHKIYSVEEMAEIMWYRFEDVPDDNNEKLSEKYQAEWTITKLKNMIILSLEKSGNKEITEKLKQKFLSAMGVIFRQGSTFVEYKSIPDDFELITTKNLRKDSVSASSLHKEKVLFWSTNSKQYMDDAEKEFFKDIIDTTNSYRQFEVKNIYDFKTPQSIVIADSDPEKEFIKRLVDFNNNKEIDKWVKSNSMGFYSIEYSWRKGEHAQRGNFSPDFFIKCSNIILVVEIKGDEQIRNPDLENVGKYEAALKHINVLNDYLQKEKQNYIYKFIMMSPRSYDVFFDKINKNKVSEIVAFVSELDASMLESINF
jgi:type III restriction enzyme